MLEIRSEVAAALAAGQPVVALESAFLSHGLPPSTGLDAARAMAAAVRSHGALPAMIGVIAGRLVVGLGAAEMEALTTDSTVTKVGRQDLGAVLAAGAAGGTTVSASLTAAAAAGIGVLATGGIGGVHRGPPEGVDVSADLAQIAATPVAVVCSGVKAMLDLERTLERLESHGVPVVGYRTDELPAFYSRRSGLRLAHRVDSAAAAARLLRAHWQLESTGVVLAVPPPAEAEIDHRELQPLITDALRRARRQSISGAAATPFLLERLANASGGRTVETNVALLAANARVAAETAAALSAAGDA